MTRFSVEYGTYARNDLKGQFDHISEKSGNLRALAFVENIIATADKLGEFPQVGRVIAKSPIEIRSFAVKRRSLVIYTFDGARILVLRVFGRGQDSQRWLDEFLLDPNYK